MDFEKLKKDILKLFNKNQLKEGTAIDPTIMTSYFNTLREKREFINDTVDDMIMKGLLIETRFKGQPSFALTRHGEEVAYRN